MATKVTGTCTITRLRMGDNIYVTLNVDGSPCIVYDDKRIYTDFSKTPLTITGAVTSMQGSEVTIKSAVWQVDGKQVTASSTYEVTNTSLKVKGAIISDVSKIGNVLVKWVATVVSQGVEQTVEKTLEITAVNNGGNSYWGTIQARGNTILSASNTQVTLGHTLNLGGNALTMGTGSGQYAVTWTVNGSAPAASKVDAKGQLTVDRDMVNGMAYVVCEFSVGGIVVESDGITIADVADELQIIVNDHYNVAYGGTVTVQPKLVRLNSQGTMTEIKSGITWGMVVRNNYTMAEVASADYTFSASTGAWSMSEPNMYYTVNGVKTEYSPVVIFSATI